MSAVVFWALAAAVERMPALRQSTAMRIVPFDFRIFEPNVCFNFIVLLRSSIRTDWKAGSPRQRGH
jgi:hypothetical protein